MVSWENPDDRVAIIQMNADLRHAQLEMLSAQCATHQLRLRFSTEDIARYGEQDVLRKAIDSANSLKDFYAAIAKQMRSSAALDGRVVKQPQPEHVEQAAASLLAYLNEQRQRCLPLAVGLAAPQKTMMRPFFSPGILDRVKIVELKGERFPNPPFYADAQAMGLARLPEITQLPSLTLVDLIAFSDVVNPRALFHGLVHGVQFQVLGAERYAELYVRAFFRTGSQLTVPLESHVFILDSRFTKNRADSFSVEDQVRLWARDGRY